MAKPVKDLLVTLDPANSANPNVTVEPDPADVTGNKIRWIRKKKTPRFEFVSLDLNRSVFAAQKISVNKRRISCNNDDTTGDFNYTITVKSKGRLYDTTERESGDPGGGKPVIRNQ
jgi:hypothetical protein